MDMLRETLVFRKEAGNMRILKSLASKSVTLMFIVALGAYICFPFPFFLGCWGFPQAGSMQVPWRQRCCGKSGNICLYWFADQSTNARARIAEDKEENLKHGIC